MPATVADASTTANFGTGSRSVNLPTISNGQLLVCPVVVRGTGATITGPSASPGAWTRVSGANEGGTNVTGEVYAKVAGGSETAPSVSSTEATQGTGAVIIAIDGSTADVGDVFISTPNVGSSSSGILPFPAVTGVADGSLIIYAALEADNNIIVDDSAVGGPSAQVIADISAFASDLALYIYAVNKVGTGDVSSVSLIIDASDAYMSWTIVVPPGSSTTQVFKRTDISYDIAAKVSKPVDVSYDIAAKISKPVDISYDVAQKITKATDVSYDVAAKVAKATDISYDIAAKVFKRVDVSYDVSAKISSRTDIVYDVAAKVLRQTDISYDVAAKVIKQTDITYDVAGRVVKQVDIIYDVEGLLSVSASWGITYDIAAVVRRQTDISYDVLAIVAKATDISWDVRSAVRRQTDISYDILGKVRQPVDISYDVGGRVRASWDISYDVQGGREKMPVTLALPGGFDSSASLGNTRGSSSLGSVTG